jgi:hypothetical protein
MVLDQLSAGVQEGFRSVTSVPGVGALAQLPLDFLRRVPGLDVALGVTAYQVRASVETAVAAAVRGAELMEDLSPRVSRTLSDLLTEAGQLEALGSDLARHTVRGALGEVGEVSENVEMLARGAVSGVLHALASGSADTREALTNTVYGAVLGAGDVGADVVEVALHSVAAARDSAHRLGIGPMDAEAQAIQAALNATASVAPDSADRLRETLERAQRDQEL